MGFRNDGYATVWEVRPGKSKRSTLVRVSTSRKERGSDEWETDFTGWIKFLGNAGEKALSLKQKDRIITKRVEVQTRYDKEAGKEWIDYIVWDFGFPEDKEKKTLNNSANDQPDIPMVEEEDVPF